jgi:SnoaL-like domain
MSNETSVDQLLARIEALEADVGRLKDIEGIRATKYEYCRLADNGRYVEFAELFTDDYVCELWFLPPKGSEEPTVMRFESKTEWVDFVDRNGAARAAVDAAARSEASGEVTVPEQVGDLVLRSGMVHQMHGGKIEFTGPDTARAIWPSYFGDGDEATLGYYDEEYRREDGRWKIARERFFSQALRRYKDSDYPYSLELGQAGFIG